MSLSLLASNVSQLVTNLVFLPLVQQIGANGTFGFFLAFNVFALFYIYLFLVETKNLEPEVILDQINNNMKQFLSGQHRLYAAVPCEKNSNTDRIASVTQAEVAGGGRGGIDTRQTPSLSLKPEQEFAVISLYTQNPINQHFSSDTPV